MKKKSTQFPNFIDVNGSIITNRRMICNSFNEYFVKVASTLNKDKYSNDHDIPEFSEFLKDPNNFSIFLEPIRNSEVEDIIAKLSNYKANDISPLLLKPLRQKFSYVLAYLLNSCMLAGVFPNELKIAKVIPLYKSGNRNCTSNYRPISILHAISKIFEKLLHKVQSLLPLILHTILWVFLSIFQKRLTSFNIRSCLKNLITMELEELH